jgi:hypothetical protein
MAKPKRLRGLKDLHVPLEERLMRTKNSLIKVQDEARDMTRCLSEKLKRAAELELIKAQIEEEIRNNR